MRPGWVIPLVIGAIAAALITSAFFRTNRVAPNVAILTLTYSQPTGWDTSEFKGKIDPGKGSKTYAVEIARRCGVKSFASENNMNWTDVNYAMLIRMPLADVSDEQFRCLANYIAPPYVRLKLERKS